MLQLTDLTRSLSPRDVIVVSATGRLRQVTVTKVTPTYVWVDYISPSTGRYHNTSFRRYPPGVKPPPAPNKSLVHFHVGDFVKVTNPQFESGEYYRDMVGEIFDINDAWEHPINVRFTLESGAFKESELELCTKEQS